jgi:CRP-like cAMP-binding protein
MPYGTPPLARQLEHGRYNRFLATLPPHDFSLLAPHLRTITLERGVMLHDAGEEIEHVYFPNTGMVSLVAVMQSGATVETATIGRSGVIGASAGLGAKSTIARAVVQLPGTAAWIGAAQFRAAAAQSRATRDLIVRYNDLLLAQVQQSVACNALHALEGQALPLALADPRLHRWQRDPADAGVSRADARRAPDHRHHRGPLAAERRPDPLPPRSHPSSRPLGTRGHFV